MEFQIVYFDESLASSWISKKPWSTGIRDDLVSKGYASSDAEELVRWAKERIRHSGE